jgi:hypothetical protein
MSTYEQLSFAGMPEPIVLPEEVVPDAVPADNNWVQERLF